MGNISKPNTFTANTTISASEVNANFDTIYDEFNGSVEAANIATNAVTTAKIADSNVTTAKIADDSVTPAKRSGGFAIGFITGATLGTTGNKAVTSVGFQPKFVKFNIAATATATSGGSTTGHISGSGAADGTNQYAVAGTTTSAGNPRYSSNAHCIAWVPGTSATPSLLANFVSLDADGFTIDVDTADSTLGVYWEAYG